LRRRPDIRRAERQLAAATARIGQAQADLYPKFSLTGFFNLQSASIDDLVAWRSHAFSIGPAISWPIFEAGRLHAAVAVRNAQQEQALTTYEQSVQNAVQEVRDQLIAFTTERQRHASLTQAVTADRDAADLAGKLYAQGLTDFLTVLDAERQLNQAENALAQSDTQIDTALIALYKALGGGWESAEQNNQPDVTHATTAKAAEMPNAK
jgi:outer membrane protein TolC